MEYNGANTDWQMQSPGWRDLQIFHCLCGIKQVIEDKIITA
jgi:hypothetical protein